MLCHTKRIYILLFAYALAGCAISVDRMHFYNGMVTVGGEGARFEEIAMTTIRQKDRFYVVEHVSWEPLTEDAGNHSLEWRMYSGGNLVVQRKRDHDLHMRKTPYRFWWTMPAADFAVGHYRVDVLIDGRVVDTHEFDITA
jgi:hypothetical protein